MYRIKPTKLTEISLSQQEIQALHPVVWNKGLQGRISDTNCVKKINPQITA